MKCNRCGKDYPSKYYFVTESMCKNCCDGLNEQEKEEILASAESLSREGVAERSVGGKDLHCPICGHTEFQKRKTLMNTPGMTFMGLEWANKAADNYVCDSCGYVFWFLNTVGD